MALVRIIETIEHDIYNFKAWSDAWYVLDKIKEADKMKEFDELTSSVFTIGGEVSDDDFNEYLKFYEDVIMQELGIPLYKEVK